MALPVMTPEQRADALLKAREARAVRAALKAGLKQGDLSLADVLGDDRDVVGKMRVSAVLTSLPGVGKVRAQQVMQQVGIDEKRRVRGLGANQRAALLEKFTAA